MSTSASDEGNERNVDPDGVGASPSGGFVVLKLGGEVVQSDALPIVAADVAALRKRGVGLVLVHGGGPQATALQTKVGLTPNIVAGRRVTDAATLDVMKMAIVGKVNVDLCAALVAAGTSPVGLHGASALTVRATKRPPAVMPGAGPDPVDYGHVGDVVGVNRDLVALLAGHGYVPVLACLGADPEGRTYNINADTVANEVAVALDARGLVLVTDVPAVLRDVHDSSSRIARMTPEEGAHAIETGVVTRGMIPKLEESFAALRRGVRAVHIVGKLRPGELASAVTSPGSIGTVLVPS